MLRVRLANLYQALTYNSDFINATERVTPVQPTNPLAAALVDCAYRLRAEVSCRPNELPLIGQQFNPVTIDAIMSRTLVSHASFGDTFRRVLESLPPEALKLFGAVTVVVVSDKINPSFVTTYSGGMYLSGRYFWRTRDEKRLVEQASDPRNSLPNRFRFDYDRRYTINGRPESFRRFRNSRTMLFRRRFTAVMDLVLGRHMLRSRRSAGPNRSFTRKNFTKASVLSGYLESGRSRCKPTTFKPSRMTSCGASRTTRATR